MRHVFFPIMDGRLSFIAKTKKCPFGTENSASNAWNLNFSNGNLNNWNNKVSNQNQVRAVSGIIGESFNSLTLQLDTEQKNE